MSKKTLSVLTPNYNHAKYLPHAIEAVAAQSRVPDEYIILDDCSSDNSLQIITEYQKKYPFLKCVKHEMNLGVIKGMQRLLAEASGDYLYFGAADDNVLPDFFESSMEMAEKYPGAGIIFGNIQLVDENENEIGVSGIPEWKHPQFISPQRFLNEYLERYPVNHSLSGATILKRVCVEETGGYRADLSSWCDTFAVRAIALKYGACYIPRPFMRWRVLPGSVSNQSTKQIRKFLKNINKAAELMRSKEFCDRFPVDHVRSFEKRYRRLILMNSLLANSGRFGLYLKKLYRILRNSF